jgi:tagaturonate epimerase
MLPSDRTVSEWLPDEFASALTNDSGCRFYNPSMRQLFHVAYKLAALRSGEFTMLLEANRNSIEKRVFDNIFNRHIGRLFGLKYADPDEFL